MGETLDVKMEPINVVDKYAVSVNKKERIVGHIKKEKKTGKFAKTVFCFLRAEESNHFVVKITGHAIMRVMAKE